MKRFEFLEHTADLKIQIWGRTREGLFSNALLAMASALWAKVKQKEVKVHDVKIKSSNLATLLVEFLSEVLYLTQVNKVLYKKVKFTKLTNREIEAKLFGQKVERFGEDIKGVTYHDLEVQRRKDEIWEARVLFDI